MKKTILIVLAGLSGLAVTCEKTARDGACIDPRKADPDAFCIELYEPVCGCDGKTYSNSCYAEKAGVLKWTKGACPE